MVTLLCTSLRQWDAGNWQGSSWSPVATPGLKTNSTKLQWEIAQRKKLGGDYPDSAESTSSLPHGAEATHTSHSSGAFKDDDLEHSDEDEIAVMEEDVDGIHHYPFPHQKYKTGYQAKSSRNKGHRTSSNERRAERRSRRSKRSHHKYFDGPGFEDIVQDLFDEATDVEANHGGQYYLDLAGNVRRVSHCNLWVTISSFLRCRDHQPSKSHPHVTADRFSANLRSVWNGTRTTWSV